MSYWVTTSHVTEKRIKKHGHISRLSKFKREIEKRKKKKTLKSQKDKDKINYETKNKYITKSKDMVMTYSSLQID